MSILTTAQYKLNKSTGLGYLTCGLGLSPSTEAATILSLPLPTTCAMSGLCADTCISKTGMNQMPTHAKVRAERTRRWFQDRHAFISEIQQELIRFVQKAGRHHYIPLFRPNLLSDLPLLAHTLDDMMPSLQKYDYTKLPKPWLRTRPNYHLTYSVSERTTLDILLENIAHGINNALIVVPKHKTDALPTTLTYQGITLPTIDGDIHDIRLLDPPDHWVLLKWKGGRNRVQLGLAHLL